jgi:hypothetical protein
MTEQELNKYSLFTEEERFDHCVSESDYLLAAQNGNYKPLRDFWDDKRGEFKARILLRISRVAA